MTDPLAVCRASPPEPSRDLCRQTARLGNPHPARGGRRQATQYHAVGLLKKRTGLKTKGGCLHFALPATARWPARSAARASGGSGGTVACLLRCPRDGTRGSPMRMSLFCNYSFFSNRQRPRRVYVSRQSVSAKTDAERVGVRRKGCAKKGSRPLPPCAAGAGVREKGRRPTRQSACVVRGRSIESTLALHHAQNLLLPRNSRRTSAPAAQGGRGRTQNHVWQGRFFEASNLTSQKMTQKE
jgi:hypothetical protein